MRFLFTEPGCIYLIMLFTFITTELPYKGNSHATSIVNFRQAAILVSLIDLYLFRDIASEDIIALQENRRFIIGELPFQTG